MKDRMVKWMLGAAGALLLVIGGTAAYKAVRPAEANAASYFVELGSICNAYIEGEAPWCAQVFKIDKYYKLGTKIF